jgi:hypothetical protein
MDYEKLQKDVAVLEKLAAGFRKKPDGAELRRFAAGLRDILQAFLKDRKEQIRPGQLFRDAAAKSLIPGDIAPRADALLMRWGGSVTPQDPETVKAEAEKFSAVAEKILPVLKAYTPEK